MNTIDVRFIEAIDLLNNCKGHIIVTGFGKSSIIGQKFVASLNSISIPAIHLHANDATHGDMGVITKSDIVIFITKSGNSLELNPLAIGVKAKGAKSLLLTSNEEASLANLCDLICQVPVNMEADEDNLIPTNSSICYLAVFDALVITLKKLKGRNKSDFGQNHPSGTLGKIYFSKVEDVMDYLKPSVSDKSNMKTVISSISSGRKGATVVLEKNIVIGIITDGDLRRALEKYNDIFKINAIQIMTASPFTIKPKDLLNKAFGLMKDNKVSQLIIVNENSDYLGILHIQELLALGF